MTPIAPPLVLGRPGIPRRVALGIAACFSSLLLIGGVLVLFFFPIPRYLRFSPGPSPDVHTLIKIEGTPDYTADSKSRLGMALVIVAPVNNFYELAKAKLDTDSDVDRRDKYIPPTVSDDQNNAQNAQLMTTSQEKAELVALQFLGYDVHADPRGARVVAVQDGAPAAGQLQAGDIITAIDDQPVKVVTDAVKVITSKPVGSTFTISFARGDQPLQVTVTTAAAPDDATRPIVGVQLETVADTHLPPGLTVTIDAENIGGPSAGLVYTLGIIDAMTPGDITGGHNVAATGEIAEDGTVGQVGGLREKAIGVEAAGAEYFLVPTKDAPEARQGARQMKVVPVDNIQQALDFLKTLRNGQDLQLPTR